MSTEKEIPGTNEDDIDGCDCPMNINEADEITDEELPAADGGVE